jgi:hypothetical protein
MHIINKEESYREINHSCAVLSCAMVGEDRKQKGGGYRTKQKGEERRF